MGERAYHSLALLIRKIINLNKIKEKFMDQNNITNNNLKIELDRIDKFLNSTSSS